MTTGRINQVSYVSGGRGVRLASRLVKYTRRSHIHPQPHPPPSIACTFFRKQPKLPTEASQGSYRLLSLSPLTSPSSVALQNDQKANSPATPKAPLPQTTGVSQHPRLVDMLHAQQQHTATLPSHQSNCWMVHTQYGALVDQHIFPGSMALVTALVQAPPIQPYPS